MNFDEKVKILEGNGWVVECESPFEIRHEESGSFATGQAAQIVAEQLGRECCEGQLKEQPTMMSRTYTASNFYELVRERELVDVVFLHAYTHDTVVNFLESFPEFVKLQEARATIPVFDEDHAEVISFVLDEQLVYTLVRKLHLKGNRLTSGVTDTSCG